MRPEHKKEAVTKYAKVLDELAASWPQVREWKPTSVSAPTFVGRLRDAIKACTLGVAPYIRSADFIKSHRKQLMVVHHPHKEGTVLVGPREAIRRTSTIAVEEAKSYSLQIHDPSDEVLAALYVLANADIFPAPVLVTGRADLLDTNLDVAILRQGDHSHTIL